MKPDDPKLTAYALDELDPADRAEVEQLLRENPEALAEVEDTERLAARLRRELRAEPAAPLTAEQRDEVLAVAVGEICDSGDVDEPVQFGSNGTAPAGVKGPGDSRRWWSRPMALAASIAVLAGVAYIAAQSFWQPASHPIAFGQYEVSSAPSATATGAADSRGWQGQPGALRLELPVAESKPEDVSALVKLPALAAADGTQAVAGTVLANPVATMPSDPGTAKPALSPDSSIASAAKSGEQMNQYLVDADGFYQTGRYDLALKRNEQILSLDPQNIAARKMQEKVNQAIDSYGNTAYNETRNKLGRSMDVALNMPTPKPDAASDAPQAPEEKANVAGRAQQMAEREVTRRSIDKAAVRLEKAAVENAGGKSRNVAVAAPAQSAAMAPAKPATLSPSLQLSTSGDVSGGAGVPLPYARGRSSGVRGDGVDSLDSLGESPAPAAAPQPSGAVGGVLAGAEIQLVLRDAAAESAGVKTSSPVRFRAKVTDEEAAMTKQREELNEPVTIKLAPVAQKQLQEQPEAAPLANDPASPRPATMDARKTAVKDLAKLEATVSQSSAEADYTARGITLYKEGKLDEAATELTKAVKADPGSATAHNYLGIVAGQKGWAGAAQKELEIAARLDPQDATVHFNLAVVLASQEPRKVAEARHYYQLAIERGSERDESLERLLVQREPSNTESYDTITDNAFLAVRDHALSTFSIDVDTASYANVRRFLSEQRLPPKGAVRIEELLNYFDYDYPQPDGEAPFSASMEVAECPWTPEHRLVRIGLKGREIHPDKRPASNLVFLVDVSGSMQPENKLPLVKKCLRQMVDKLGGEDTVAIAVYAGASGCVLEPTNKKSEMRAALDRLESGGSTNGAAGIQLAYQLAERSFIKGGVNRVILATDGDFNVGVTNQSDLTDLIEKKAKSGVFLTVLGFGMGNLKDSTLEKLADKGNGNYAYIDTLNEGRKVLVEQMSGTLVTIAKDVKIQVEFNPAQVGAYRLIGYENRMLKKEDFNDDTKDAGEIGAGHTVTALYEVVPAGVKSAGIPAVDPLKYQPAPAQTPARVDEAKRYLVPDVDPAVSSKELLTLKLRYKATDGDTSKLLEFPLTDDGKSYERSSRDFRFAAAVASFGMLLRDSPHKGKANWSSTLELALEGKGEDRSGYRAEFVSLIERAKAASR